MIKDNLKNLKYIKLDIYNNKIVITGSEKTRLKNPLEIKKYNFEKNSNNNKKISIYSKSYFFSIFIGGLFIEDIYYLIFGKRVKILKFGNIEIYEINSVVLYDFTNEWKKNEILSKKFSQYFNQGFFFSYDIDLTYNQNYKLAFEKELDYKKILRLNFFFFANRFMIDNYFQKTEWMIPLIHGKINISEFKYNNKLFKLYFIYKKSILTINKEYQKDIELFQDFCCPDEFDSIDIFKEEDGIVNGFEIIINDYFGKFNIFLENKFDNNFDFRINYHDIKKHLEFMNSIMDIDYFIFQNDSKNKKTIDLIKDFWTTYKKNDKKEKKIIKNIKITKNKKFLKILKNIKIINDQFKEENSKEKFSKLVLNICGSQINDKIFEIIFFLYNKINSKNYNGNISQKDFTNMEKHEQFEIKKIKNFIKEILKLKNQNLIENLDLQSSELETKQILYGLNKGTSKSLRKNIDKKTQLFNYNNILISFITHNCGGLPEDKNLIEKIKYKDIDIIKNSNLIIIGLQEILEMKSKNFSNILFNNNEDFLKKWIFALENCFPDFYLIGNLSMLGLVFIIFQNKFCFEKFDIKPFKKKLFKFGFMSFADKGAIFLGLKINYEKIALTNCHLQSGNNESGYKERKESLKILLDYLISKKSLKLKLVLGDLNFRNNISTENLNKLLIDYNLNHNLIEKKKILEKIKKYDEFLKIKKNKLIINDFFENKIDFLPSYKWIRDSKSYDFKEGTRIPSWTDRIIYKNDDSINFASILYEMDSKTSFSDHK